MSGAATANKVLTAIDDGRLDAARRLLEPALEAAPTDPFLRGALVGLHVAEHDTHSAVEVALALLAEKPTDPQVLECSLRGLSHGSRWVEVAETYERILPLMPAGSSQRKGSLENLLLAYARLHRHADVQKVAAKLKSEVPTEPKYVFWAAMANLGAVAPEDKSNIVLKVTAAVMDKQLTATATFGPQHCLILTEALERQGNFQAAIDFVSSARCRVLSDEDRLDQLARFHVLGGDVRVAGALYRHLWTREPENWNYSMSFADALATALTRHPASELQAAGAISVTIPALGDKGQSLSLPLLLPHETNAADVAATLAQSYKATAVPRGLQLAQLELHQRLNLPTAELSLRYVTLNASRPSCFLDVIKYVPNDGSAAWTDAVRVAKPSMDEWTLDEHAQNVVRLQLVVATDRRVSESDDGANEAVKEILRGMRACPPPTEVGDSAHPWPQYLVTACNAAARRYAATNGDSTMRTRWAEIGFRITALAPRGHKYPAVHLFALLFCRALGTQSLTAINALDFKSVQLDSMSFLCLQPLLETRDLDALGTYAAHASHWYSTFERDTGNLVAKAYHNVAWSQLRGLARFQQAIAASVARPEWLAIRGVLEAFNAENIASLSATLIRCRALHGLLALQPTSATCNDDRNSVAAAALLAMPGSPDQVQLLTALMPSGPALPDRLAAAQGLVAFLLCMHDLAARVQWLQKASNKPSAVSGKKGKAAAQAAAPANPAPAYFINDGALRTSHLAKTGPILTALADFTAAFVGDAPEARGEAAAAFSAAFDALAASIDGADNTSAVAGLTWPTVPCAIVALRVVAPVASKYGYALPAKPCAQKLVASIEGAQERLKAGRAWQPVVSNDEADALGLDGSASAASLSTVFSATVDAVAAALRRATTELTTIIAMK